MPGAGIDDDWLEDHPEGIPALQGWGNYNWKVSTNNDSAQFYFNQGINMYYSFHMIEASASFAKSATFDPNFAMAYWGQALAKGPNINYPDVSTDASNEALRLIEKAKVAVENASPLEKKLVETIAYRYSIDTTISREKLNTDYAIAMKGLYADFPSNADAMSLYADALMVQHPWDLYNQDETPKTWTPAITAVLEKALAKFPNHPAINHYYIHAIEASATPGRAIPSADRLSTMMPEVSHMVHMPSHIYIRTGNYKQGIDVNTSAISGFNDYRKEFPAVEELAGLYLSHNEHMQVACAMMAARSSYALKTAEETQNNIPDSYFEEPSAFGNYLQSIHMLPTIVKLRFGNWNKLLEEPFAKSSLAFEYAYQLFAKGMAAANTNKPVDAGNYLQQLQEKMNNPILKEKYAAFANSALASLKISEELLQGTIAINQNKLNDAINFYKHAVDSEDAMLYGEPQDWLLPARHYLGDALLQTKNYKDAELVYRKDLAKNPANSWSLYGLMLAQNRQKKTAEVAKTKAAFKKASADADVKIASSVVK